MTEIIHEITRTRITVKGVVDAKGLQKVFDKACEGRLASMLINYDKASDLTTVLLSPCRITEEFCADNDGQSINNRTVYQIDKSIMKEIFKRRECNEESFISKVWMPFKKSKTEDSIVLPRLTEVSNCYTFELLSCGARRGSKAATAAFRNRTMKAAKHYFMEIFATYAEKAKPSKPAATLLNELSCTIDDAICSSES